MGVAGSVGGILVRKVAPQLTGRFVRYFLEKAIDGAGPLPGAAKSAEARLKAAHGDVEGAIEALITQHSSLAAGQGFLTNVGGVVTLPVTIPANVAGMAVLQCHLAAGIAHLRGYDLNNRGARNAVLVCLLDSAGRKELAKQVRTSIDPVDLAVAPPDPELNVALARAVTAQFIAAVGGLRMASFVARRTPVLGGGIGAYGDRRTLQRIGHEADALLHPRPKRGLLTR